jgi:hypothetical protein
MMNTTPINKVTIDLRDEPELKAAIAVLQPGDIIDIASGSLMLDQQDDYSVIFSIEDLTLKRPDNAPLKTGDLEGGEPDEDDVGVEIVKGDKKPRLKPGEPDTEVPLPKTSGRIGSNSDGMLP